MAKHIPFHKNILIIDFEGVDHPIQIGAVLLDKETLEEKDYFVSYIHAHLDGSKKSKSGITQEMIDDAPTQAEVGKLVYERFGSDICLASFVQNLDVIHLQTLLSAAGIHFKEAGYDYHVLDIWPLAYVYLLKQGYVGGIWSEEIFQAFDAKPRGFHDALEDCRITADVLRKIVFNKALI
jgi:DNA polymerase III epsilon subunit-like protein